MPGKALFAMQLPLPYATVGIDDSLHFGLGGDEFLFVGYTQLHP